MRNRIDEDSMDDILDEAHNKWLDLLNEKGHHIFASSHETLGVVSEEMDEYKREVRANAKIRQRAELMDIIVACLHGIASIDTNKQDW